MIDCIVDDEEAVVVSVAFPDRYGRILTVMSLKVQRERFCHTSRDNLRRYAFSSLRQHQKHRIVDVVVNEDDASFCGTDQVGGECVCVEDLAVEEDALFWRRCGLHEKPYLLFSFADALLQSFYPSVDSITAKKIFFQNPIRPLAKTEMITSKL